MEDRLHPLDKVPGHDRLSDSVGDGGMDKINVARGLQVPILGVVLQRR
ncbi:hypothetical protein AB0B45_47150 [Nonomuraea sp. NPDC049152]